MWNDSESKRQKAGIRSKFIKYALENKTLLRSIAYYSMCMSVEKQMWMDDTSAGVKADDEETSRNPSKDSSVTVAVGFH